MKIKCRIRTAHGTYLRAGDDGIVNQADRPDAWETFDAELLDDPPWADKDHTHAQPEPTPGPIPTPTPPTIPHKATDRLKRVGTTLRHNDDSFTFLVGATAFPIQDLFMREGASRIEPYVDATIAHLGHGCIFRALGMAAGVVGGWTVDYPGVHPRVQVRFSEQDYLDGLDRLCPYLKIKGARLKLDLFADCRDRGDRGGTMPDASTRRRFAQRVVEVGQVHTNLIVTAGNEFSLNDFDPIADFPRDTYALLTGRGSGQGDEEPPQPALDVFDIHTGRVDREHQDGRLYRDAWRRRAKWLYDIKTGNDSTPQIQRPGGVDEPIGIGERFESGRTTVDPQACGEFAALCKLFGDYVVAHVRSGLRELMPGGPITAACLDATREYTDLIPDDARTGRYTRGGLGDCPIEHSDARALRTFFMFHQDRGVGIVLDPSPDWQAVARDGWRVVSQSGPKGQILRVTR